jgi:hypothetical protein
MVNSRSPWSADVKRYSVSPTRQDIARFQAKAMRGELPEHAVRPLAAVYAAAKRAQTMIGPGHLPLDAIFDAFPDAYCENWAKAQLAKAA